jgi:Protein kinase domain
MDTKLSNSNSRRRSSTSVSMKELVLFRPLRWLSLSSSTTKQRSASFVHPLDRHDGSTSWDFSEREHNRRELEELKAATWKQNSRIALLGLSEIHLEAGSSACFDTCNVDRIVLADEYTAEYLQQEKHRLQLQLLQQSHRHLFSLKRIPAGSSTRSKKRHLKLLLQEASILVQLGDHPNIPSLRALPTASCPCYDFFLLTDRLHPDTLETRMRLWHQQGWTNPKNDDDTTATPNEDWIPRKTNYALQIAQALQACHDAGIVVRDLCPETIGFSMQDPHCIQLIQLGHAMDTKSLQVPTKMVGNQRYLAAEVWKTGQYSFATDVYR